MLLATAVAAAAHAAGVIRSFDTRRSALHWEQKSHADFVSEVDLAAEQAIAEVVAERHPDATVVGEELSPEAKKDSGLVFVVDPLDGTTNYLHGYPAYAVSIGAVHDGSIQAGAVLNVVSGELFTATAGGGARRSGEPIRVSDVSLPARALVGTGFPFRNPELLDEYVVQLVRVIRATSGVRRAGSAALDLCDVACGRLDAFWELRLAPWDVAAGILVIREAGGAITHLDGQPAIAVHGGYVAGNPVMHSWLMKTLAPTTQNPD